MTLKQPAEQQNNSMLVSSISPVHERDFHTYNPHVTILDPFSVSSAPTLCNAMANRMAERRRKRSAIEIVIGGTLCRNSVYAPSGEFDSKYRIEHGKCDLEMLANDLKEIVAAYSDAAVSSNSHELVVVGFAGTVKPGDTHLLNRIQLVHRIDEDLMAGGGAKVIGDWAFGAPKNAQ